MQHFNFNLNFKNIIKNHCFILNIFPAAYKRGEMLPAVAAAALETPDRSLQADPDRGAGAETADLRHAALCRDCNYCGVQPGSRSPPVHNVY